MQHTKALLGRRFRDLSRAGRPGLNEVQHTKALRELGESFDGTAELTEPQ
ncbi:hypothetical protein [Nocardia fluminea]